MAKRVDETAWQREYAAVVRGLKARRTSVRTAAIARVCELFDPLAKSLARTYQQSAAGGAIEDLEQEARVGLLEACKTFDPTKGAFPSHAMWTIRDTLSKYVEGLANPVVLPAWMIRRLPKLKRMSVQMSHELLRKPTVDELAERMKMPPYAIATMFAYSEGADVLPSEVDGHETLFFDSYYMNGLARSQGD